MEPTNQPPQQEPQKPEQLYIKPRRHYAVRWGLAGFVLFILDATLLIRLIDGGQFALIYGILLGFTILVSVVWAIFTPAIFGWQKKK